MSLLIVTLAREGLGLWLGAEFASKSTAVLQWLTVGVLINSLAHVPFALIQGTGRADLTAKLHLVELPFYLAAAWWLIEMRGIEGAAMAWTARVAVDACVLFVMATRLLPESHGVFRRTFVAAVAGLATLGVAFVPSFLLVKGLFLVATLSVYILAGWQLLLSAAERDSLRSSLASITTALAPKQ